MRQTFIVTLCAVVVSLGALCGEVRAEEATSASSPLVFRDCESAERQEIARLVALDLASSDARSAPAAESIELTCLRGRFEIAIARPGGPPLTRSIDLEQLPARARARIVAIAVVELLAADATEDTPPATLVLPTKPSPAPTAKCCAAHLALVTSGRIFFSSAPSLFGAGLRAAVAPGALALDALAEFGAHDVPQGSTHLTSFSSSLSAGWAMASGPTTLRLAAGVRTGAVRLSGEPAQPSQLSGRTSWRGWGGPKLEANLMLFPSSSTQVQLNAETGYTLFSVYALGPGERNAELRGVWLGLQLGVGLGL